MDWCFDPDRAFSNPSNLYTYSRDTHSLTLLTHSMWPPPKQTKPEEPPKEKDTKSRRDPTYHTGKSHSGIYDSMGKAKWKLLKD